MARHDPASVHAAQAELLNRWREKLSRGSGRLGWKIGINDPRAMRFYGLNQSVVGFMTHESIIQAGRDFESIGLIMAEPELALRIDSPIDSPDAEGKTGHAIGALGAALELLSFDKPRQTLEEVMGHNIFHLGVCLGDWIEVGAGRETKVRVRQNDESVAAAAATDVLPELEEIVALVARTLSAHGESLEAGDIIISGSMTPPLPVESGHTLEAEFEGLGRMTLKRPTKSRIVFQIG